MKLCKVTLNKDSIINFRIEHHLFDNDKEYNDFKMQLESGKLNNKTGEYEIEELDIEKVKYEDFRTLVGLSLADLAKLIKYI